MSSCGTVESKWSLLCYADHLKLRFAANIGGKYSSSDNEIKIKLNVFIVFTYELFQDHHLQTRATVQTSRHLQLKNIHLPAESHRKYHPECDHSRLCRLVTNIIFINPFLNLPRLQLLLTILSSPQQLTMFTKLRLGFCSCLWNGQKISHHSYNFRSEIKLSF